MRVEVIESQKRYDYERVRCVESWVLGSVFMNSLLCLSFLFVSTEVGERGRRICFEEYECVATAGRIGGLCYHFCILLSLPLVS